MFQLPAQPYEVAEKIRDPEEVRAFYRAVGMKPLTYFCPTGKQAEYIQKVGVCAEDSTIPVVVFTAANGVGKTVTTVQILLNIIYGAQNGWFDYPIFHRFSYPKLAWYCSTGEALRDKIVPLIDLYAIQGTFTSGKEGKTYTSIFTFTNGWRISLKTYDQDVETYESADVGVIILDEPAPQPIWNAVKSRRRLGCLTLIPMTPLFTPPYLYDEVKKACDSHTPGYYPVEADVYSACRKRGIRGYLNEKTVDEWVRGCDPEERDARVYGRFAYFSQVIYPGLDRSVHYVEPSAYPIPPYSIVKQVVDPHDSRPPACIFAALCPNGRIIIFDETPERNDIHFWEFRTPTTIRDDIISWNDVIRRNAGVFRDKKIIRIMDRHFGWQLRGKRTFAEMYSDEARNLGIRIDFEKSYQAEGGEEKEVMFGHKQVRKALLPLDDGRPGLVIWKNCVHTWEGLTHYVRKKEITKSAAEKPVFSGRIIDKYRDFPDVVRYLVCDEITAHVPAPAKTLYDKRMAFVTKVKNEGDEYYD